MSCRSAFRRVTQPWVVAGARVIPRALPGLLLLSLGAILGCATIISGPTQSIKVESVPDSVNVYINLAGDREPLGRTPLDIEVARSNKQFILEFEADGSPDREVLFTRTMNPIATINVFGLFASVAPGVVGFAVDVASSSFWGFKPIYREGIATHTRSNIVIYMNATAHVAQPEKDSTSTEPRGASPENEPTSAAEKSRPSRERTQPLPEPLRSPSPTPQDQISIF